MANWRSAASPASVKNARGQRDGSMRISTSPRAIMVCTAGGILG